MLWEYATAVAGRLLGINPFDQPDVESAKKAARGLLDAQPEAEDPAFVDDGIEVRGTDGLLGGPDTLEGAVDALLARLDADGYLAVMAYLDREADAALADGARGRSRCAPSARSRSAGDRASCTRPGSTTRAARRRASSSRSPPPQPVPTWRSRSSRSPSAR